MPELPTAQYYVEAECHHTAALRGFAVHFRLPLRLLLSCPSAALGFFTSSLVVALFALNLHVEPAAPRIQNPNLTKHLQTFRLQLTKNSAGWRSSPSSPLAASPLSPSIAVYRRLSRSILKDPNPSQQGLEVIAVLASRHFRHFATLASSSSRGPLAWLSSVRRRGALGAFDQGGDTHAHGRRRAALSWAEPVPTAEAGAPTANSVETSG